MKRTFLFLQGPCSPFFARLADGLVSRGQAVGRINFNVGDAFFWGSRPALNYRGRTEDFPEYLVRNFKDGGYTDVIMVGDTRPLHRPVPALAEKMCIRAHVVEEGYVRPNWLTLERGGINGYSRLPRDPAWYREVARRLSDPGEGRPVRNPLRQIAWYEVMYHFPNLANPLFYPGYRTHRPHISGVEFAGWINRFARFPWYTRRDDMLIRRLCADATPFVLVPLQLDSDAQIRTHSPFDGMSSMIRVTMESFAKHAPAHMHLVFKNHPLDTGLVPYARQIERLTREFDVAGRVHYLETGHLPTLVSHARGVVVINSTVGISALLHGRPTICLGRAIYDLPGLTFQGRLDAFWRDGAPPDRKLFGDFRKTVVHTTQINGGFYCRQGIDLAVENSIRILTAQRSPLEALL